MTKEEILKRVKKFQGANREFSQELPPIIEGLVDLIDEAGPEVVNNLTSNSPTKALSANMGKELKLMVDGKVSEPETAGTAGQILQLDEEGVPEWVDAAEVGATYDSTVSDTSTNAIQNKTIKKYVDDNFAQKDGYYGSLTAGAAENLVGRGSVPAEFAFRTSGGDQDLGTGTAQIVKIKGRTEAFNQLFRFTSCPQTAVSYDSAKNMFVVTSPAGSYFYTAADTGTQIVSGHNYLLTVRVLESTSILQIYAVAGGQAAFSYVVPTSEDNYAQVGEHTIVAQAASSGDLSFTIYNTVGGSMKFQIEVFDLTLEGLGLTTADQFRALHPLGYYNYNAGVLKNNAATGLETTGFNQWDEEWESGSLLYSDGSNMVNGAQIRTKNYIPVIPGSQIYINIPAAYQTFDRVAFYDANKVNIPSAWDTAHGLKTVPSNACYIRFTWTTTTYNHDICVNLSWSGYRNGEYEPYEKHTLNLGLDAIACHDEEDNAVVVNGLDGVGNVYDEAVVENGMVTKIIKRMGEVDLGSLEWTYEANIQGGANAKSGFRASKPADLKNDNDGGTMPACICGRYPACTSNTAYAGSADHAITYFNGYSNIYIVDSGAGSDAAAFKTAMAGVKLRYELDAPITLTVDEPFAASYYVNDFGTEARLPQDTADDPQAPFCADVQYAMNATDAIRNLPRNYVSINSNASDDSSLKALAAAISTALGIAVTWTWSESDREYTFSVADNRAFKLVSVPASASASGTAGNIAIDSNYLYICVATDTWKRVAIATWE